MSLQDLLAAAVGDDPWYPADYDEIRTKHPEEIRLVALAPEAVALLIDMAALIDDAIQGSAYGSRRKRELLARFAALNEKAGT